MNGVHETRPPGAAEPAATSHDPAATRPRPPGTSGLAHEEPLIFERSRPGRTGFVPGAGDFPDVDPARLVPEAYLRADGPEGLPEVSEPEVVRHYTRLSQWNYSIDTGLFPLGSCTMKHNPKTAAAAAALRGFAQAHPYLPARLSQGALQLEWELANILAEVSGFDAVTLQPAAGAQGELCGLMMARAYHAGRGNPRRTVVIPDTAHGTNPASSALNGYQVVQITSGADGVVHPEQVAAVMSSDVAVVMLTNPNTLGLFETHIAEIAEIVHAHGALLYCDGANMNAVVGRTRPGDWGVDLMQFNLHKTFATPHGGGGPGAGPVAVKAPLEPYLPTPVVGRRADGTFRLLDGAERPESIGRVRTFLGNFGVHVRAYAYLRELGAEGLADVSGMAVLNANYLRVALRERFAPAHDRACMHECVLSDRYQKPHHVSTLDIAKRLIDKGFHPPTIYFPLVVPGALMIEPTETESRQSLDAFVAAMLEIADEAERTPDVVTSAPHLSFRRRFDEAAAARRPILVHGDDGSE